MTKARSDELKASRMIPSLSNTWLQHSVVLANVANPNCRSGRFHQLIFSPRGFGNASLAAWQADIELPSHGSLPSTGKQSAATARRPLPCATTLRRPPASLFAKPGAKQNNLIIQPLHSLKVQCIYSYKLILNRLYFLFSSL